MSSHLFQLMSFLQSFPSRSFRVRIFLDMAVNFKKYELCHIKYNFLITSGNAEGVAEYLSAKTF